MKMERFQVFDNDPVIYNSERSLSFTEDQALLTVHSDGTLNLKEELSSKIAFKPIKMQV